MVKSGILNTHRVHANTYKGDPHTENEGSISYSPPSVFPQLTTVGLILGVCALFVAACRPVYVSIEVEGGNEGMQGQEVSFD